MLRLAILSFKEINTVYLEEIARLVVPNAALRRRGGSEGRYRSYLAGRCVVKSVFSQINAQSLVSPNTEYGFLEVVDTSGNRVPKCFVNISHTEQLAVAALSDAPVGVDVESRTRSAERVLSRVASDKERGWVSEGKLSKSQMEMGRDIFLWSAKEAAAKSVGLGMKFGLQMFEISSLNQQKMSDVLMKCDGPLKLKDPVVCFEAWEDYFVTVCSERSSVLGGVHRRILTPRDLQSLRQESND